MQNKPKQILHLVSHIRASGAERLLSSVNFIDCQPSYSSTILAFGTDAGFGATLRKQGYRVDALNRSAKSLKGLVKFGKFLARNRQDVIHLHLEQNFLTVCLLARFICPRARIVRTVHGLHEYQGLLRVRRIIWTRLSINVLGVKWVVVSRNVERIERRYIGKKPKVIENWPVGISENFDRQSLDSYIKVSASGWKKKYLLLGNCDINKNHFEVLNRFKNDPYTQILHLGDMSQIDTEESSLIGSPNVKLLSGESWNAISIADEVIVPSILEASSMVVLESLLMRKPVHVRKSWGTIYTEICKVSDSIVSDDFIKLIEVKDYEEFRNYYNAERGISEYMKIYGIP